MSSIDINSNLGSLSSLETHSSSHKHMRVAIRHWQSSSQSSPEIKLICHGLGGHSHSVTIRPIIQESLDQGVDVLALDWPGHGCSSLQFQQKPQLEDMMITLDEVIKYLSNQKGYSSIHLIGHSMGSLFAIYWGIRDKSSTQLVSKITAMNPGFPKISTIDEWIVWIISKSPLMYGHSVLSHSLEWTDDVNQVDLRFRDPLELKYIGDALLIPLFQARKLILRNYHLQKIPVSIIWSPNDPIIDAHAVRKILTHKMYFQKGDFVCPYHELCTTYMSGKQVCQQVLL